MRPIDADALHYNRIRIYHEDGIVGGYNAVVFSAEIKDAPTLDAVPVVRCNDCKWSTNEPYRGDDVWICNFNQWRRSQGKRKPDFFCADGERREDERTD